MHLYVIYRWWSGFAVVFLAIGLRNFRRRVLSRGPAGFLAWLGCGVPPKRGWRARGWRARGWRRAGGGVGGWRAGVVRPP
jgi:hypothetical protein